MTSGWQQLWLLLGATQAKEKLMQLSAWSLTIWTHHVLTSVSGADVCKIFLIGESDRSVLPLSSAGSHIERPPSSLLLAFLPSLFKREAWCILHKPCKGCSLRALFLHSSSVGVYRYVHIFLVWIPPLFYPKRSNTFSCSAPLCPILCAPQVV